MKLLKYIIIFFKLINKQCSISCHSNISLNTIFEGGNLVEKNVTLKKSYIGKYSYVAYDSFLDRVKVGRFSSIGPSCMIGLAEHPLNNFISTHPIFYSQTNFWKKFAPNNKRFKFDSYRGNNNFTVEIGSDVWIGAGVKVLDGVNVADGCVVAAGSILTKSTEPFGIYAGVPARMIRKRTQIDDPMAVEKWWNKDLKTIAEIWQNFHK